MQKTLLAIIATAIVAIGLTVNFAMGAPGQQSQPADKAAATASDLDTIGEGDRDLLLSETMRVSSTSDLILATSAECSILTSLHTVGGSDATNESDGAFGQVKLWIEIDGDRVPVSTDDTTTNEQGDEDDFGEVVFCNRAYQRTVIDREQDEDDGGDGDGLDEEDDFIRTRTSNAFNWMAFDVGKTYDASYNGNNIVDVKLYAEYDRSTVEQSGEGEPTTGENSCGTRQADNALEPYSKTCADAFVGSRSLIIEAVHAANHEQAAAAND
jgi:hypothetical protein